MLKAKFFIALFVVVFLLTVVTQASQKTQQQPEQTKLEAIPPSAELVMNHILKDGPKDFQEDGWRFVRNNDVVDEGTPLVGVRYIFFATKKGVNLCCLYSYHQEGGANKIGGSRFILDVTSACVPRE